MHYYKLDSPVISWNPFATGTWTPPSLSSTGPDCQFDGFGYNSKLLYFVQVVYSDEFNGWIIFWGALWVVFLEYFLHPTSQKCSTSLWNFSLWAIHNYQCFKILILVQNLGGWVNKIDWKSKFDFPPQTLLKGGHTSTVELNLVFVLFSKSVNLQSVLTCIWGWINIFPDQNWGWVGGCKIIWEKRPKC